MKAMLKASFALAFGACAGQPDAPNGAPDLRGRGGDAPAHWSVGLRHAGAIRYGMSIVEVRAATGDSLAGAPAGDACGYVVPRGAPVGLGAMVEQGRIVRVDVDSAGVPTDRGAVVGMPEADVRRLYPDSETSPHKYDTAGSYLTVVPASPADSAHRIIFELGADGRVIRYRAGLRPAVEYVERCG
jgi:hypothetical protein